MELENSCKPQESMYAIDYDQGDLPSLFLLCTSNAVLVVLITMGVVIHTQFLMVRVIICFAGVWAS